MSFAEGFQAPGNTSWLRRFLIFGLVALVPLSRAPAKDTGNLSDLVFRFHVTQLPGSVSPLKQKGAGAMYLLGQLYFPLLQWKGNRLHPLAGDCRKMASRKIRCQIQKSLTWTDGSPLLAEDYVQSFRDWVQPENRAFRSDLLLKLKNAESVLRGDKKSDSLGVWSRGQELWLELEKTADPSEFLENLAHPLLTPFDRRLLNEALQIPLEQLRWPGRYRIDAWNLEQVQLRSREPNLPNLKIPIIFDEAVALKKYQEGELDWLRRLPTSLIESYKNSSELIRSPQHRMDAIYLSPKLPREVRKALAHSLRYADLSKLLNSPSRPFQYPGCFGIPDTLWGKKTLCHNFSEKRDVRSMELWSRTSATEERIFVYSKAGGDDFRKIADWLQLQWNKNLGLQIQVQGLEDKIFQERVQQKSLFAFRKGWVPESSSCLSAVRIFHSRHPENWARIHDKKLDAWIDLLGSSSKRKPNLHKICYQILNQLLEEAYIIPLGAIDFVSLLKPHWTGLEITAWNQLSLGYIRRTSNLPPKIEK
ncbi:MAG: ABC transporter substrate-binding protein [Bdellovibrio sp.]